MSLKCVGSLSWLQKFLMKFSRILEFFSNFRKEDLDWKTLETIGIHKEELEKSGDMELLLQGEETETVPLKIRTPALRLTMDATLRITVGTDGKPVMEINGISPEAESEAGG